VAAFVCGVHAARVGCPSYSGVRMVNLLLLQQWYTASDPEI